MEKFLEMCKERDVKISTLAHETVTSPESIKTVEGDLDTLRKYLNGYAFLLDIHLDKVQQITNLIDSLSSKIEKNKLRELKDIIQKQHEDFLLKSIQNTVSNGPELIKKLLKS